MDGFKSLAFLSSLATLLLIVPFSSAIGMSPAYREIYFEPGMEETFHFIMIGNKDSDLLVKPYVDGDLANYTTVPDETYLIPAAKGVGFAATVSLPETLPPGMHMLRVGIMEELPPGTYSGIVAKLGVESLIGIRVPYPAKYLDMTLRCDNAHKGDGAVFDVEVFNRGSKDLDDVNGFVEIFSVDHKKIIKTQMKEGSLFIAPARKADFTAEWDTSNAQPGIYDAVATINYDGNQTSAKCNFRLGDLNIDIKDFGANDTQIGSIAKFVATLQSTWNSEIPQVFNEVEVHTEDGDFVGSSSGETIRVGSWSEKKMTVYWDTGENGAGNYVATLTLEYQGKNSTRSAPFRIIGTFEWLTGFLESNWHILVIIALVLLIAYQAIGSKRPFRKKGWRDAIKMNAPSDVDEA
jgi:hypothetical protein